MTEQHTHEWVETTEPCDAVPTFMCTDCGQTTPGCNTCGRPLTTANLICDHCLEREREVLATILAAWRLIGPDTAQILQLGTIDHDTHTLAGVPIGAADRYDPAARDDFEELVGVLRAHPNTTALDLLRDPENVIDILHEHADDWATRRGTTTATGNVIHWLTSHLLWAAQTLPSGDWANYRTEVRKVQFHLRRTAGILPERNPAPCVHCGGKVVQDWADKHAQPFTDGLSDTLRCTGCGTTWGDRGRFDYLNLTTIRALPGTHPDRLVTLEQARLTMPTARRNTINQRIKRDRDRARNGNPRLIPERGTNLRGQILYRLGDLTDTPTHATSLEQGEAC